MTEMPEPTALPRTGLPLHTRLLAFLARFVMSSVARVRVEGMENVPQSGPLIVAVNHLSNADPPLVGGWLLPALGRPVRWLAKEQLFVGPLGPLLRSQGVVMVRKGRSDVEAYRLARAALARGEVIVVFPEGTRSVTRALQEAKPGVALLASRSGVPVLPIGISGTDRFLPPDARFPRLGTRVTVRIGPPISFSSGPSRGRREELGVATDLLMSAIAALLPARYRGRYR